MPHRSFLAVASLLVAATISNTCRGGFTYDEAIQGDLSDNRLIPSSLVASAGSNVLTGTFGPSTVPGVRDLDYVTLTIPVNHQIEHLYVLVSDVGGGASFIGVQTGTIISVPPNTVDPSPLLGWAHFGSASAGTDLLPEIGFGAGAIGFSGALGSGQYTFWIMELADDRPYNYSFDFDVTRVPNPGTLGVAVCTMVAMGKRGGRRRVATERVTNKTEIQVER